MTDVHTAAARSRNMAAIGSVDTGPELLLRRALFARGLRFRLHDRKLPGRPDLVFARYRAVVFMHGCFFHGHECDRFRWPASRAEFWREKIIGNRRRDAHVLEQLAADGWRTLIVWECALTGVHRRGLDEVAEHAARWIRSAAGPGQISGYGG